MKLSITSLSSLFIWVLPLIPFGAAQAQTPPITAESGRGTGTNITINGNQFDISGGTRSGGNLFHSFDKFGLNQNQTANFLANPNLQNILGRVVGGSPSLINGLIKVTVQGGLGNPHLFLINPSGIIFDQNASLNVPGAFTATTATGIGFGNSWFNAIGKNDYKLLVGNPSSFAFTTTQPGAIINAGNLNVPQGDLTLVGGNVISTGKLSAPGRQITVVAVPGKNVLRISEPGQLLSLEIVPLSSAANQPETWTLPVKSLPELLTGGNVVNATGLTVNGNEQVLLTASGTKVDSNTGTTTVSGIVDAANLTLNQSGGSVQLLGNKVALVEQARVDVSGNAGGGRALIGGDYQGKGQVPNAAETFVGSNAIIKSDAISNGNGGKVIVWADNATRFYGNISARGGASSGDGGFVEVSGKQNLAFAGLVDVGATVGKGGQLLLDPASVVIGTDGTNDNQLNDGQILATDIGNIFYISATKISDILKTGNVSIAATNDITLNSFIDASANTNTSNLALTAPLINLNNSVNIKGNITFNGAVNNAPPSFNRISTGGNITFTNSIDSTNASTLILEAGGNVGLLGTISRNNPLNSLRIDNANNVDIRDLPNHRLDVNANGNLNIQTAGNIALTGNNFLSARGDIQLIAPSVTIQDNTTSNFRTGRDLIVQAPNNILINNSSLEVGRNINLQGQTVTVQANSNLQAQGDLTLRAQGLITVADSQLYSLGNMQLLGQGTQGRVQIQDNATNPVIVMTGGNLNIQGDQQVNIQALTSPQSVFQTKGNLNLVSNGTITGNGRFVSGGDFSAINLAGEPGSFSYNPISSNGIISSNGNVNFGNYTGLSLKVEARGSINGGDITITGPNTALTGTDTDIAILSSLPTLILQAGLTELRNNPTVTPSQSRTEGGTTFTATTGALAPGNIKVGKIDVSGKINDFAAQGGRVILSGTGNIETGNITTDAINGFSSSGSVVRDNLQLNGTVEVTNTGNIKTGKINTNAFAAANSFVSLTSTAGNIEVQSIDTGPGGLYVRAFDLFRVTGVVNEGPTYTNFNGGIVGQVRNLPVSIILRPTNLSNPNNVPVQIQYGNGSVVASQYATNNVQPRRTFVQSGDSPFATGPIVTGRLFPDINSDVANGVINQTYRVLNPDEFPTNVSGTVGAIAIGAGSDSGFYGSFQNRPFIPPPTVDPVRPVNPSVDPVRPVNPSVNPVLADNPSINPSLIANNSSNYRDDNSPTRLDKLPTDQDLKAQVNNSNSLRTSTNTGQILKVSPLIVPDNCYTTGMELNQDGTIKLIGSCEPKENEQLPKNLP